MDKRELKSSSSSSDESLEKSYSSDIKDSSSSRSDDSDVDTDYSCSTCEYSSQSRDRTDFGNSSSTSSSESDDEEEGYTQLNTDHESHLSNAVSNNIDSSSSDENGEPIPPLLKVRVIYNLPLINESRNRVSWHLH